MLKCPKCLKKVKGDPWTGLYFCESCGYQGTLVIEEDESL